MVKRFVAGVCCLLCSLQVQAEMTVSSVNPSLVETRIASTSILIRVHIPMLVRLKLNTAVQSIISETNLQNNTSLVVSCHTQQGLPLAQCTTQQIGQVYTLTTL